ncbi:MAG: hypothetical protein WD037_12600 [Balneolales bacterium]
MTNKERTNLRFFNKSDYFIFVAAFISCALSVILFFSGEEQAGIFVAIWVPSILGFANYIKNKIGEM